MWLDMTLTRPTPALFEQEVVPTTRYRFVRAGRCCILLRLLYSAVVYYLVWARLQIERFNVWLVMLLDSSTHNT